MEWLWLILSIVGLGLLWLLIMGMEKLTERLKANDEARRIQKQDIAERTAEAEAGFNRLLDESLAQTKVRTALKLNNRRLMCNLKRLPPKAMALHQ